MNETNGIPLVSFHLKFSHIEKRNQVKKKRSIPLLHGISVNQLRYCLAIRNRMATQPNQLTSSFCPFCCLRPANQLKQLLIHIQ